MSRCSASFLIGRSSVAFALMTTTAPEQTVVAVELKLDCLAPVKGGVLASSAGGVRGGRRIALGKMEVRNNANPMATGLATL